MEKNSMTAVEWFHDKVHDLISDGLRERIELLKNEAKQMEKEQIVQAYKTADQYVWKSTRDEAAEQYYNETYGKD